MDLQHWNASTVMAAPIRLCSLFVLMVTISLGCEVYSANRSNSGDGSNRGDGSDGGPSPDEIASWSEVPERPRTWEKDVVPIVVEYCGPCHVGPTPDGCIGGTCLSNFYEAFASWYTCCAPPYQVFKEEPESCPSNVDPVPVWACGMHRIYTFEEQGKDPMPEEQVRVLEEWIEDGTPER